MHICMYLLLEQYNTQLLKMIHYKAVLEEREDRLDYNEMVKIRRVREGVPQTHRRAQL